MYRKYRTNFSTCHADSTYFHIAQKVEHILSFCAPHAFTAFKASICGAHFHGL